MNDSMIKPGLSRRRLLLASAASALASQSLAGQAWASSPARVRPHTTAAKPIDDPHGKLLKSSVASEVRLSSSLQTVADDVLASARHAVAIAALEPKADHSGNPIAAAGARYLARRPKEAARAKSLASAAFSAPLASRQATFGSYAGIKAKDVKGTYARSTVVTNSLRDAVLARAKEDEQERKLNPKHLERPRFSRVDFHLNSVKCIKTTDGWGADEIKLGGWLITPTGQIQKINPFYVSENFKAGMTVAYDFSPCQNMSLEAIQAVRGVLPGLCPNGSHSDLYHGRILSGANIGSGKAVYGLTLMMAEIDWGGFGVLLNESFNAVKAELHKQVSKLGVQVANVEADSLEAIIIQAAVWVLLELIGWFISWAEDDFMGERHWMIQVPSSLQTAIKNVNQGGLPTPSSASASPMKLLTYSAHGGRYDVRLHWRAR